MRSLERCVYYFMSEAEREADCILFVLVSLATWMKVISRKWIERIIMAVNR